MYLFDRDHWANLYRLKNILIFFYITITIVRGSINIILQCTYMWQRNSFDRTINPQERQVIEKRIYQLLDLMQQFGQIHREIGPIGIFYYAIIISGSITFYMIRVVSFEKIFNYVDAKSFVQYLIDPDKEEKIISERIDMYIRRITYSNLNFTESLKTQFSHHEPMKQLETGGLLNFKPVIRTSKIEIPKTRGNSFLDKFKVEKPFSLTYCSTEDTIFHELSRQREYLRHLSKDKSSIWPQNRRPTWAFNLKRFWLILYLSINFNIWIPGEILCYVAGYLSHQSIKKSIWTENYRQLSLADRLSMSDYAIFVFVSTDLFYRPITILVTSIKDQMKHLSSLKWRMLNASKNIKQFAYWQNNLCDNSTNQRKLIEEERKELRFLCDKSAIEVYICYQLFRDDIQGTVKIAQSAANQYFTFVAISLFPVIIFFQDASKVQIGVPLGISLLIVLSLNGAFWFCAALHSSCNRIAMHAWSFIAFAEGYNQDLQIYTRDHLLNYQPPVPYSHCSCALDQISNLRASNEFDFTYYDKRSISPHTIMLWRRLVEHHDLIQSNFIARLYGIFKIDYAGVLKFNYLLLWLTIYTLNS